MLQFEAQLLSKQKKILLTIIFTPIKNCISLSPFHITQVISKKIHQFVKDILHNSK